MRTSARSEIGRPERGDNGQAVAILTTAELPLVVGIGASAGGLEAFKRFLGAAPADSGMAFVLVQHLSPSHKSMLAELLGMSSGEIGRLHDAGLVKGPGEP